MPLFFLGLLYFKRIPWQRKRVGGVPVAGAFVVLAITLLSVWFYGERRIHLIDRLVAGADTVRLAVVQGNIDQARKWDPAFQEATVEKYIRYSLTTRKMHPDLVVWPETATPFYFLDNHRLTAIVLRGIQAAGCAFLIGSPSFRLNHNRPEYYNSAYLISPSGQVEGRYDKVHLVPFGEYVPFKRWLPFLGKIVANVGDFKGGTRGNTLRWRHLKIGTLICFEIIFPRLSRAMANNQAAFLVNMTNDAWFGQSSGPFQHFSMAIFRAIENRRALIRAANTGISAFIDPVGRVIGRTPLDQEAVLSREVPVLKNKTWYTRHGDVFAIFCLLLALLAIGGQRLKVLKNGKLN